MKKPIKKKVEKAVSVDVEKELYTPTDTVPRAISKLEPNYGRDDINQIVDKLNEIIEHINVS